MNNGHARDRNGSDHMALFNQHIGLAMVMDRWMQSNAAMRNAWDVALVTILFVSRMMVASLGYG